MASLARLGVGLARHQGHLLRQRAPVIRLATISTSRKNKDTVTLVEPPPVPVAAAQEISQPNKNWISWGFDNDSEVEDNTLMHMTFFVSVTLCLVTLGFVWAYVPDFKMLDWAQREGFMELRRREAEGLPLIDPNLTAPEKMELPSDEELGNTEIII